MAPKFRTIAAARPFLTGWLGGLAVCLALCGVAGNGWAWVDLESDFYDRYIERPNGIFVADGSMVMNVGELHMNITNWGLIGSQVGRITSYSDAPSAQWPAGSGNEYLWSAGLWVGGIILGERLVSTGQYQTEILPRSEVEDTIYEGFGGILRRPPGNPLAGGARIPEPSPDDDDDGLIDEETLNGYDDDEDGQIDEDFGQVGNQMMVCTMYDNTALARENFPDHTPLNLEIVQNSYAWENDVVDDFVGFEFQITNIGQADISNVYIGFFADCDIRPRGSGSAEDDLAGSFRGMVRATDGSFVPVEVGYMYDDAESARLDGYIGILFLSHDTDPTGRMAPESVGLRSYHSFSGQTSFDQGGDPTNDSERYELLSNGEFDANIIPAQRNDYRFMVSAGPFSELPTDGTLTFQAAFVIGGGLTGLLNNCAEAALTFYGNYFDQDNDPLTGKNGRESIVCKEDFEPGVFENFYPDFMDTTCIDQLWLLGQPQILPEDIFEDPERGDCAYVNMDVCFECARQLGRPCLPSQNDILQWNCNQDIDVDQKAGCTGVDGAEFGVNWLVGMAPPPPGMRLWPVSNSVHLYWDNRSETTKDVRLNAIDFEAYRVWRADNWDRPFGTSVENGPSSNLWQMIAEYDLVNHYISIWETQNGTVRDTLPLGANTGLENIRYSPRILENPPGPPGLADSMQVVVDQDKLNQLVTVFPMRDEFGQVIQGLEPLLPWESYPVALDTFFAVTSRPADPDRGVIEKDATRYYEYVDNNVHNGYIYFYSVTATDHAMDLAGGGTGQLRIRGQGQSGDPGSSFSDTRPASPAQTPEQRQTLGPNIFVYPNPATPSSMGDFQPLNPNSEDPTGVRVNFANLPQAENAIKIYTLDGDLVQEIQHNGFTSGGEASWNLVSRNGQEIVSGIYLYTVQSPGDSRFEDFIGKFVVVR